MPDGIRLDFPFHFRGDRIFKNKKGKVRRRVTVEVLEGDVKSAFDRASRALVEAGYKPKGSRKGDPATKQSQAFTKKGKSAISLASNVKVGKKPANPNALGLVSFEWTPTAATE